MKRSAGTLLYRRGDDGPDVLLVHPSGETNRAAPWSMPKGEPVAGESLAEAAARETREEIGVTVDPATLVPLGAAPYQPGHGDRKTAFAFAAQAPADCDPHGASWEVNQAAFFPLAEARKRIHPDQAVFLERLAALTGRR